MSDGLNMLAMIVIVLFGAIAMGALAGLGIGFWIWGIA
jgi:hypothetical protein